MKNKEEKNLWLLSFLILTILALPAVRLFLPYDQAAIPLALLSGLILAPLPLKILARIRERTAVRELALFIRTVLNRLNLGDTLLYSIYGAARYREKKIRSGKRRRALRALLLAIENNSGWTALIPLLNTLFPCPQAAAFFSLLKRPEDLGERVADLFRRFEVSLREEQELRSSLAADRAKALSECLSLLLMPVLLLLFLRFSAPAFLDLAYKNKTSLSLLLAAFLLFLASLYLVRRIFLDSPGRMKNEAAGVLPPAGSVRKLPLWLSRFLFEDKLDEALNLLFFNPSPEEKTALKQTLARRRLRFFFYALLLLILFLLRGENPWPAGLLLLPLSLYPAYEMHRSARLQREKMQDSLPALFSFLTLCLHSFYSLETALKLAEKAFAAYPYWADELRLINRRLLNRESPAAVLSSLAQKLNFPEAGMYLTLLEQISDGGTAEDLALLDVQSLHFHHVLKEKQRQRLAARSNRYLLPMVLDLLAVMMISFAPLMPGLRF